MNLIHDKKLLDERVRELFRQHEMQVEAVDELIAECISEINKQEDFDRAMEIFDPPEGMSDE